MEKAEAMFTSRCAYGNPVRIVLNNFIYATVLYACLF